MVVPKALSAYIARVRLLSRVRSRVNLQLFGTSEPFGANPANVWFFTSVRTHVNHKLPRLDERFGANGALVRPFTGVDAHVTMEFTTVFKCASTNLREHRNIQIRGFQNNPKNLQ